jgi:hypothetical protein
MPTYKLGPVIQSDGSPATHRRPLICERCEQSLGNVPWATELDGIPAKLAGTKWLEMKGVIERHEADCPAANK